jgi:hypothetical protein
MSTSGQAKSASIGAGAGTLMMTAAGVAALPSSSAVSQGRPSGSGSSLRAG